MCARGVSPPASPRTLSLNWLRVLCPRPGPFGETFSDSTIFRQVGPTAAASAPCDLGKTCYAARLLTKHRAISCALVVRLTFTFFIDRASAVPQEQLGQFLMDSKARISYGPNCVRRVSCP